MDNLVCVRKNCLNLILINNRGRPKKYCSESCKNIDMVSKRRQKLKRMSIAYKGGACEVCGYNKDIPAVYDFHHSNPAQKDFNLGRNGHTRSWERIRLELDKCMILCANCHREIHASL